MSTMLDVYLHGSVHLTNPGLEELLADTLSQGMSRSLLGPRGPADLGSNFRRGGTDMGGGEDIWDGS